MNQKPNKRNLNKIRVEPPSELRIKKDTNHHVVSGPERYMKKDTVGYIAIEHHREERKTKRIEAVKKIALVTLALIGGVVVIAAIFIYINISKNDPADLISEIYLISTALTGLISIVALCLGIIGGSTID